MSWRRWKMKPELWKSTMRYKYDCESGLKQNSFIWFATPFLENWWLWHICQTKQNFMIVMHNFLYLIWYCSGHCLCQSVLPPLLNWMCFSSSLSFACYSEAAHCSEPSNISSCLTAFSFHLSLASGILLPFM